MQSPLKPQQKVIPGNANATPANVDYNDRPVAVIFFGYGLYDKGENTAGGEQAKMLGDRYLLKGTFEKREHPCVKDGRSKEFDCGGTHIVYGQQVIREAS